MLSGETAAGLYPEEAVKTMRNIAVSAEAAQDYKKLLSDRTKLVETSLVNAIGISVAHTALNLNVKAIVALLKVVQRHVLSLNIVRIQTLLR